MRLSNIIDLEIKKAMYQSFILSNFNYCPVVWMLCSQGNIRKMEKIQLRALRFLYSDFTSSYDELLIKCGQPSVSVHLFRTMAVEVYK